MRAKLQRLQNKFPNEVEAALYQESQADATECKKRCPVDKGTLRGTIHVEGPTREGPVGGQTVYTLISCGGPAAPYAVIVHENLKAHHEVGQAKFIESVVMESRSTIAARVLKRIDLNRAMS